MNRREFLATTSLGLAASSQAADAEPIALGFSLYGMKTLSLADGVKACSQIGYDSVELAVMPGWPGEPKLLSADDRKDLRTRLKDARLSLPAIMENCPLDGKDEYLDRLKAAAELGHALSPKEPPVIETILGGKPDQWEVVRNAFADRLGKWAKLAEREKITIGLKAHRFGTTNRPEHVRWLLDQVKSDRLQAVYDWSHFEQRDMKLADTLKELLPVTRFVHVKDTVMEKGQAKFVLPGEGSTDYIALLKGLKDAGYSGSVCVEVSGMVFGKKDYDPVAAAKKCYAALAPAFEKAGVRRG